MITKKVAPSDASWGSGQTVNAFDLPEGVAFRLIPRDGLAAYPRSVEVDSDGGRVLLDVVDGSWMRAPGARSIKINAAPMPLADTWAALSTLIPTGFNKQAPPVEVWTVQVAEDDCDLVAPAPQLPPMQTLWTADLPPIPTGETHDSVTPLFDTSPWRAVQVSLFTTIDTAFATVSGFYDVEATPPISAALVIGSGGNQQLEIALTTPAAADTQPTAKVALFSNGALPAATGIVQVAPLPPFLFAWHHYFGTHNVRMTFRGYR